MTDFRYPTLRRWMPLGAWRPGRYAPRTPRSAQRDTVHTIRAWCRQLAGPANSAGKACRTAAREVALRPSVTQHHAHVSQRYRRQVGTTRSGQPADARLIDLLQCHDVSLPSGTVLFSTAEVCPCIPNLVCSRLAVVTLRPLDGGYGAGISQRNHHQSKRHHRISLG